MFSHVSDEQLSCLARCVSAVVSLPPETPVIQQGESSRGIYLLCRGTVRIQRTTPYGLFVLATLGPGSLFGELAFIDRGPRSGDAVTTSADTELVVFDPDALDAACREDQRLQMALTWLVWESVSSKLRQTNEDLNRLFGGSAPPAVHGPVPALRSGREISVDVATKRQLLAEMSLGGPEAGFLATLSHEKAFSPHQMIFRQGEEADEMYVVVEGRVMISKLIPGGGEEALGFIERGGCFGEMGLIDREPRIADARAHENGAVVLAIPREALEEVLDSHDVSSLRILNILCALEARRLRELNDRLVTWFILSGGSGISWPADRPLLQARRA